MSAGPSRGGGPTILQLVPTLDDGGVERGALEIGEAILKAGGRALIATAGGRKEARFTEMGGEIVRLPMASKNPLTMRRNAARLKRIIRDEGVSLIHARSRAPAWSGYWAARAAMTPFVTTYHGAYNEGAPFKRRYNSIMARGRPTIAVSDFIAEIVMRRHGVSRTEIVTIPRGADLAQFSREKVTTPRMLALMQGWKMADEDRPVFMLPGRLTRWKGQEVFVAACGLLRKRIGPAFHALIVGGGNDEFAAELDRAIDRTGTSDCVSLTGPCDDMPAAYMLADFAVSASTDPEAFGRVAVEAQAMAKPVLASDHGGARETVLHGKTGLLFKPRDPAALADAMEEVLGWNDARRSMASLDARAHAAANFSIDRMQQATLDVYEQVLGTRFPRHR